MSKTLLFFSLALGLLLPTLGRAESFQLARDGKATASVVVSSEASAELRATAGELAEYLQRITGSPFEVVEGDGARGVSLTTLEHRDDVEFRKQIDEAGVADGEVYRLQSHADGVRIVGASDTAVRHGAWDLLYRLGHRQFFPGKTWEVVPQAPDAAIDVDVIEAPDYAARRIWYGYGTWHENEADYRAWCVRNRMASDFDLNTGHAYGGLIRAFQAEFDEHPEYYALLDGERNVHPQAKLCVGNPAVRALAVRHAVNHFQSHPDSESASIDPSDGGGWCECDECAKIGKPSDLALTLANEISAALEEHHPDKFVAMYAYNQHSPPPTIEARPRVIVNVATSFLKGGLSATDVIEGWKAKGVRQFGIREYYSIIHWDHDVPGRARGARLDYLQETIPKFHAMGARFLTAESSENWGPNGLGYYLSSRMLWDTDEAKHANALVEDFLQKSFGPAAATMREFYELLNGQQRAPLSEDLVGRMYRLLDQATQQTADANIQARLDDLILYTRYLELYRAYSAAPADERLAKLEAMLRHTYRMRKTGMVHSLAQYRTGFRDRNARIPPDVAYRVPEDKNPWKSSAPWKRDELDRMVSEGIAANPLRPFQEVAFSDTLVPANEVTKSQQSLPRLGLPPRGRGVQTFYTWVDEAPRTLAFQVTGGLIKHYRDRGPARLELQTWDGDAGEYVTVASGESAPDGVPRTIELLAAQPGLHRVQVSDGSDMTEVIPPEDLAWTLESSTTSTNRTSGRSNYYFYVPKGTKTLVASEHGTLHDPDGEAVAQFKGAAHYFHIEVPEENSGKLWSVRSLSGALQLMTVPPYLAAHPDDLLLPEEVVAADSQ